VQDILTVWFPQIFSRVEIHSPTVPAPFISSLPNETLQSSHIISYKLPLAGYSSERRYKLLGCRY